MDIINKIYLLALRTYALVALIVCSSMGVYGADAMFEQLDSKRGLCDNTVTCIRQDKYGFVWIGTANGLCRYDGLMFYPMYHQANDETTLCGNYIYKVEPGKDGIWISTNNGVDFLDFAMGSCRRCQVVGADGQFVVFSGRVNALLESDGYVFAADDRGQLYLKDTVGDNVTFRRIQPNLSVFALCKYRNRVMAIGPKGVYMLSADGRKVMGYANHAIQTDFKSCAYYSDNDQLLYVGNGIGRKSHAFRIMGNNILASYPPIPNDVMAVADHGKSTVFAMDGGGICVKTGKEMMTLTPGNSNLCGDAVYSLFADNAHGLWVGTYRTGITRYVRQSERWWMLYDRRSHLLSHDIVTSVVPDQDNALFYIGTDGGGLNILDWATGKQETITASNSALPANNIVSMVKDTTDIYLCIYTKGVVRMSLANREMQLYHMPAEHTDNADHVWTLCDDNEGNIWVGGPNVSVFNKRTGKITVPKGLEHLSCSSILRRGKSMWISGIHHGIYKVDIRTRKILRRYAVGKDADIQLPCDDIKYLYVDSRHNIWFASESSGLFSLNETTRQIVHYDEAKGLTNGMVVSMAEDPKGTLWIGTTNGLFHYHPKFGVFVRFDENTPVPTYYTYNSALSYKGKVYMGSVSGMVCIDPMRAKVKVSEHGISFVSLSSSNDGRVLQLFGGRPGGVTLSHDENFFSVKFSVPDVRRRNRLHFACKMEGLEENWRDLGMSNSVSYTNVPPGKYALYVRCTDSNGQWLEPSELELSILPPWYATMWAKCLWVLLMVGAIVGVLRFCQHEAAIKHELRIAEISKESQRKLDEAKLDFYTRISHELRTPAFLIAAQVEELLNAKQSILQVPVSYLFALHRNVLKLNRLIGRIIDYRKIDEGKLKLRLQCVNVSELCANLTEDYENLCGQKDIEYQLVCAGNVMLDVDPDKLESILSNLVSNAFKYTKEGGRVVLEVVDKADRVVFSVKDNGIGILDEMQGHIFESFFRTERGEKQSRGDGLGLSFVKSLVELHGGKIYVSSKVEVGSVFTFYIPKQAGVVVADIEKTDAQEPSHESLLQKVIAKVKPMPMPMPSNPAAIHSVLIIDEDKEAMALLERSLLADFKVYTASNGEEGMEKVKEFFPDVVICDLVMPKMDGITLLDTLREDKALQKVKVLVFAATTSDEDMMKAYQHGASAFLVKPSSLKLLRMHIDKMLANPRSLFESLPTLAQRNISPEDKKLLQRCQEIIEENLADEEFCVPAFTEKVGMSHSALYKKIKTLTGLSIVELINEYKIYKAVLFFQQGFSNIEDVALQCGFTDVKTFRKLFKRRMKMTPSQYISSL